MADIQDPENTILIELKDGTVTIELLEGSNGPIQDRLVLDRAPNGTGLPCKAGEPAYARL